MSVNFRKILARNFEDYDYDRCYPKEHEIWTLLDNQTQVLVNGYGYKEINCIVLRTGFWYKKGQIVNIPIERFPYISFEDGYKSQPYKWIDMNKKLKYELGDVLKISDKFHGVLIEIFNKAGKTKLYFKIINVCPEQGDIICMDDPYENYRALNQ